MTAPQWQPPGGMAGPPRSSAAKRYGPLIGVLAVVLLVGAFTVFRPSDGGGETASEGTTPVGTSDLPVTYNDAKAADGDLSVYPDNCDPETGNVKLPSIYAPPCVPEFTGDNGGETYQGVSSDTIKIVEYRASQNGDLSALLQGLLDPPENQDKTKAALQMMFDDFYETYGRKIEIIPFEATGQMNDETAATADAIKVADEIGAFASWGGPALATSYQETLASKGVLCIGCGQGTPDSAFQENAPYLWGYQATPEQFLINLGDFVTKDLNGRKAEWGGDDVKDKDRVFGVVHFEQEVPVYKDLESEVAAEGKKRGYETRVTETYTFDIAKFPERAQTIIAKMKSEGVTTIIFLGDPLMPIYLTEAATAQNYFPEWVVTGTVLTDSTTFGRRYDPEQWKHAFGLSSLPARTLREDGEAYRLHNWYFGEDPAASTLVQLMYPAIQQIYLGVHLAGPNLTPESFRDALFSLPPAGGGPTSPHISFGDRGYFTSPITGESRPDYLAIDDTTLMFWDAEAFGKDESGCEAAGMWRYYDMGKRYMPGEMPGGGVALFDPTNTVTIYGTDGAPPIPAEDVPPEYPSPNKTVPYDQADVIPPSNAACTV